MILGRNLTNRRCAASLKTALTLPQRVSFPLQPSNISKGSGDPAQTAQTEVWRMRKWMWTLIRPGGLTTPCLRFHDVLFCPRFERVKSAMVFSKVWPMAAALACALRPALCDGPCRSDTNPRSSALELVAVLRGSTACFGRCRSVFIHKVTALVSP